MKKILKFVLERPEWDALFLGILLIALPFLFADNSKWGQELLKAELPEWDEWPLWFLGGIPLGALIAALIGKKFKLSLTGEGSGKLVGTVKVCLGNILGGILTAAGLILAGDLLWNRGYGAVSLYGSGWLFICSMLVVGCALSILWNNRSAGKAKGEEE